MSTTARPATTPVTRSDRLSLLVAGLSLLYGALGVCWLLGADWYPFGPVPPDGDKLSLLSYLPEQVGAGLLAVLGFLGVPAAVGHCRTEWSPSVYRPLLAFTAVEAVVFGLLAPSVIVVMVTGYLLVLVGLPLAAVLLAVGALRQSTTRWVLAGLVVMVAGPDVTIGLFDRDAFQQLAEGLATVPAKVGLRPLLVFGAFLLGGGWAALGVRALRPAAEGLAATAPGAGPL